MTASAASKPVTAPARRRPSRQGGFGFCSLQTAPGVSSPEVFGSSACRRASPVKPKDSSGGAAVFKCLLSRSMKQVQFRVDGCPQEGRSRTIEKKLADRAIQQDRAILDRRRARGEALACCTMRVNSPRRRETSCFSRTESELLKTGWWVLNPR